MNFRLKLLLLLLCIFIVTTEAQNQAILGGRVLDKERTPIKNARVYLLYEPCETCMDYIIPTIYTNEDGVFFFLEDFGIKSAKVFIEESVPAGYWNPISTPHLKLSSIPRFHGISVKISKSSSLNLGDIEPTIKYEKISIHLKKLFAIESSSFAKALEKLKVEIKDDKGMVIEKIEVPKSALDKNLDVNLVLPQGSWSLTFSSVVKGKLIAGKISVNTELPKKIIY